MIDAGIVVAVNDRGVSGGAGDRTEWVAGVL